MTTTSTATAAGTSWSRLPGKTTWSVAKVETTWHLAGGHGNDFICADDGFVDKIYCGPDEDRVYADDSQAVSDEIAKNCETVNARE